MSLKYTILETESIIMIKKCKVKALYTASIKSTPEGDGAFTPALVALNRKETGPFGNVHTMSLKMDYRIIECLTLIYGMLSYKEMAFIIIKFISHHKAYKIIFLL